MNKQSLSRLFTIIITVAVIVVSAVVTLSSGSSSAYAQEWSPLPTPPAQTPVPTTWPLPTPLPTAVPTVQPTPISTPIPTVPPSNILGYHTVRFQETLFCIGRAYGVNPWAIASQNNIPYPYYLRVGQVLAIPNVAWANPVSGPVCQRQFGGTTPPQPPVPPPGGCRVTYVVRRGDTLSAIAWRYGSSVWAIAARNNIANPNLIFPGQVLCIP